MDMPYVMKNTGRYWKYSLYTMLAEHFEVRQPVVPSYSYYAYKSQHN